jgi:succinate dehydrogenase hydrophobic anchor subunit
MSIVFLLIFIFTLCSITFALLVTPFFSQSKTASLIMGLTPLFFYLFAAATFYFDIPLNTALINVFCIIYYPVGFALALLKTHELELRNHGATFSNLLSPEGIGFYMLLLLLSITWYSLVGVSVVLNCSYRKCNPKALHFQTFSYTLTKSSHNLMAPLAHGITQSLTSFTGGRHVMVASLNLTTMKIHSRTRIQRTPTQTSKPTQHA